MDEKKITTWPIVNLKIKIKQVKPVDFATSILQIALYLQDVTRTLFAQYTQPKYRDLSTNNTRRYWSWIFLWQSYLTLSDICMIFFCKYNARNLV